MKNPVMMIAVGLCVCLGQLAGAPLFGNAPKDEAAIALKERIVAAYRSQGIERGIQMLDADGRAFIKGSGATGKFDFFSAVVTDAANGSGREDLEWRLAVTEWCYNFSWAEGEGYWYRFLTPVMHERYFEAGRYGAARAVLDRERTRKLEGGRELDIAQLATDGRVNAEFPAIARKTLGGLERIETKDFPFFISQAQQDLVEGKWRSGMEAAALASEHAMSTIKSFEARPNLVDSKAMASEMTANWRRAKMLSADGFRFLDLPELEVQELEELSGFEHDEWKGWSDVMMGRSRASQLTYILGRENRIETIKSMEEIRQEFKKERYTSKEDSDRVYLMIADIHFRDGNAGRGWAVIDEIRNKAGQSRDMKFEVDREWARHRVNTGNPEWVEPVLISLLTIAREGGLKQREIELYEIYARLLVALGRYGDALVIQKELVRLLKSFDLFPRLPGALYQLAAIHALLGEGDRADSALKDARRTLEIAELPDASRKRFGAALNHPLPEPSNENKAADPITDLQPMKSMTIPLEGLLARGLFTLTNLSGRKVAGELQFQGDGLVFRDPQEGIISLNVSAPDGLKQLRRKVAIAAGDFLAIDLSRNSPLDAGVSQVSIRWQPDEGNPQSAEWTAEDAEVGISFAITDAGEYLDNPFYLIPVYHLLQYKDAFAEVADIRVVASAPARVELYDQDDELVFVDVDGDGSFVSEGDMISKDLNRNSLGDLTLDAAKQEMRFRLFVRPVTVDHQKPLSLDLQLLQQGEWVTHSTDRIVFPEKGE